FGSPTQHTIDIVGAYVPAIMAALTVIPVYFIGKALFNRWAGVMAAGLIAILPGEYLGRSILGFTDHHVAEVLFTSMTVMFLILAIKSARKRSLDFGHIMKGDWRTFRRPVIYAVLGGIFLGLYMITWIGAMFFIFIFSLYFLIQFIINHIRGVSSAHLAITAVILFLVALVIFIPLASPHRFMIAAMIIAILATPVLYGVSRLISGRNWKPWLYPVAIVGVGVIGGGLLYVIDTEVFRIIYQQFEVLVPSGASGVTTMEMQPFLSPAGSFSTQVAWGNYTTSFFLLPGVPLPGFAFIGLGALIWLFIKRRADRESWVLLFTWTLITLLATLGQRRFAYYFSVNVALLTAFFSWQVIWLSGLKNIIPDYNGDYIKPDAKDEKQANPRMPFSIYHINAILAVIVVVVLAFSFNIVKSKEVASAARFAPSDGWQPALTWMKDNTPAPLGNDDAYFGLYERPRGSEEFDYPESAYSVISWWDYGYWISRIAHRIPVANPSQAAGPIQKVAGFFLNPNPQAASEAMADLNPRYVIIDHDTSLSKFWAIVTWNEGRLRDYEEIFGLPYEDEIVPVKLFYPAYYETMVARLYNFNGEAITETFPIVITYEIRTQPNGSTFKEITNLEQIPSYEEALAYMETLDTENALLVGSSPLLSPIPLEALDDYELVYGSDYHFTMEEGLTTPQVKIFSYTP
ncbi:MAG: oligosaccharyl transferase, archaeosortase A system-associated, partial [Dehalococcoidales bacterium]|nr:oligosaccharyl transferase, archaeosortase A system-associated [Dehalococcoidales bacterium]